MLKQKILLHLRSPTSVTLILIAIVLFFCDYNFRWKNEQWKYAVHTDAADYYRYLPTVIIDQHFNEEVANPIKYFVGTAIMYAPFFFVAIVVSFIAGLPVDGYSLLFPVFISIGTLFYLMFGLHFFSKFLKFYIKRYWVICVVLVSIAFGTTAYYYTVNSPGWAHIVAFALICFLLYNFKKIIVDFNKTSIIAIISAGSFLFFVRPTDVVIFLIAPFLATDLSSFWGILKNVLKEKKAIFIGVFLALIPMACQLGIYKVYKGEFFVWSYTKEGFDFLHPEIMKVLFSYTKGFFVYTPICFLALFGLLRLYKTNHFLFIGVSIYILINIYIISSWWCWNYGYSFGPRAFIEHYPLFFLLLALLLDVKSKIQKLLVLIFIFLFTLLNLFQIYQTLHGILDQDLKTDRKGYWDVFLSMDKGYSGKFYRLPVDESKENIVKSLSFFNDAEKVDTTWLNPNASSVDKAHSGTHASKVGKDNWYSLGLRKNLGEIPYSKNTLIRVSAWFFLPKKGSNSYFTFSFVANGKSLNFNPFQLDGYTQNFNQWEHHVFELYMPKLTKRFEQDPTTLVEFYYFNNSEIDCYIDDLTIEFIEFKTMDRVLDLSWK